MAKRKYKVIVSNGSEGVCIAMVLTGKEYKLIKRVAKRLDGECLSASAPRLYIDKAS